MCKLKQITVTNPNWIEADTDIIQEIIKRAEKERCFFEDDSFVSDGIVLGIVNAKKEGEDYRALILGATEYNGEKKFILSSAIISFGMAWHEKHLIQQQLSGEEV